MAKCLFKQPKCCLWNIECGDIEYVHQFACEFLLGAVFLAGASVSGVAIVLTKKYQKKLTKVIKLVDIVTSALAVFETSVSKALNNGEIDERVFQVLQDLYLKVVNELANINHKI